MDPNRQIRLIIAPFFFYATIISAGLASNDFKAIWPFRHYPDSTAIIGLIALSTLPLGFLLNAISSLFFTMLRSIKGIRWNVEFDRSDRFFNRVRDNLGLKYINNAYPKKIKPHFKRNLFITFDHEFLKEQRNGIFEWQVRLYSVVTISFNSALAILLGIIYVCALEIKPGETWCIIIDCVIILLLINFFVSRRSLLKMHRFRSYRKFNNDKT